LYAIPRIVRVIKSGRKRQDTRKACMRDGRCAGVLVEILGKQHLENSGVGRRIVLK